VWKVTQCLVCLARSLHEHWYHDEVTESDEATESMERDEELVGAGAPES
jgi:hypothetical protein